MRAMRQRRNSGQILLIAAFIMASLLVSAQIYIVDTGKITSETNSNSLNDFLLSLKLGSRHVLMSSLANITDGGSASVLAVNLQRWSSVLGEQYFFGKNVLNYTLREASPYSSGIWIGWGTNGVGVSSVYTNFTYRLSDREAQVNQSYSMNITTMVTVESQYRTLGGDTRQVNVTINMLNEGEPALAKQITIYYRALSGWQIPDTINNYEVIDYGNGTYTASFMANIPGPAIELSGRVIDQRQILVQANATSTQI